MLRFASASAGPFAAYGGAQITASPIGLPETLRRLDNPGGMLRFASASAGPFAAYGGAQITASPIGLPETLRRLLAGGEG
jgi:hypothetical protein